MIYNDCIYFNIVNGDKLIIPIFDISKIKDFMYIDNTFFNQWKDFIKYINDIYIKLSYEKCVNELKKMGYKCYEKKAFIKVIGSNVLITSPDFYNATSFQIVNFIEKSEILLNDIKLRNENDIISTLNINFDSIRNFNIELNVLFEIAKSQISTRISIYLGIALWFCYYNNKDTSILEKITYCKDKIFYCDNFIKLVSLSSKNKILLDWCNDNMNKIIWDEDLVSDVETVHINNCKTYFTHPFFIREVEKRWL